MKLKYKFNYFKINNFICLGTWIDLKINDSKIGGYFLEFNDDTLRLRIKDTPPASVYEQPQMSISIADDRFVMDFLLDFWKDEKWRTLPGMKNFLKAYLVLPMTFGKVRGKVNFINQVFCDLINLFQLLFRI